MSASGMPLTLASGYLTRVAEGVDSLYIQKAIPSVTNANLELASNGTGELRFATDSTRAVTIDSSQRVGIGVSTSLTAKTQIEVADNEDNYGLYVKQNDTTNNKTGFLLECNTNPASANAFVLSGTNRNIVSDDDGTNNVALNILQTATNATPGGTRDLTLASYSYTDNNVSVTIDAQQLAAGAGTGVVAIDADSAVNIGSASHTATCNLGAGVNNTSISIGTGATSGGARTISIGNAGASSALSINISANSSSDITLYSRGGSITVSEVGHTSLTGFTNTSIIGALNELKATGAVTTNVRWKADVDSGTVSLNEIVGATRAASTGQVALSDANGAVKNVVGVSVSSGTVTAGNEVEIASAGQATVKTSDSGAWTMSEPIYMSGIAGEVTNDVTGLVAGDIVQQVGFAIDTSTGTTRNIVLSLGPVVEL